MPLDENFPTYHYTYTDPKSASPTTTNLTFTANGSPPQQLYTLSRAATPQNTYTLSLVDAHFPSITYSTLTTNLSQSSDSLILPKSFTLHLFAPDSSVTVNLHTALLGNHWDFILPQHAFLPPSQSVLDSTYTPPVTETLRFRWRKEGGVLSRSQLRCSLIHDGDEPDTALAMYAGVGDKAGRGELVVYESNFRRVEMEDLKGLEMVMLMTARVINDIWFLPMAVSFNAPHAAARQQRSRGTSAPQLPTAQPMGSFAQRYNQHPNTFAPPRPAPSKPLDPEKRRLQEAEKRRAEAEKQRAIEAEQAAIRLMLAEEQAREKARKQALVDAETERLRRVYEREEAMQRRASVPQGRRQQQQYRPPPPQPSRPQERPPAVGARGGGAGAPSGGLRVPDSGKRLDKSGRRKSFLGLSFGGSGGGGGAEGDSSGAKKKGKLLKKASSMW